MITSRRPAFTSNRLRARAAVSTALAFAALGLLACGGSNGNQADNPHHSAPDAVGSQTAASGSHGKDAAACKLFNGAEVQSALGSPVTKVDGVDSSMTSICTFSFATDSKDTGILVEIYYNRDAMKSYLSRADGTDPSVSLGETVVLESDRGHRLCQEGRPRSVHHQPDRSEES